MSAWSKVHTLEKLFYSCRHDASQAGIGVARDMRMTLSEKGLNKA